MGEQQAAFNSRGILRQYSDSQQAINEMLSKLGLLSGGYKDEFEAVGLHLYRYFDEYFKKY